MRKTEWIELIAEASDDGKKPKKEKADKQLKESQCTEVTVDDETKAFLIVDPPEEMIRTLRMISQQVDACRQSGRFKDSAAPITQLAFITVVPLGDITS